MVPYFVVVLAGRQARLRPPPRLAQFLLGPFFNLSMGVQYQTAVPDFFQHTHFLTSPPDSKKAALFRLPPNQNRSRVF
jgi:hypothetical protein